MWVNVLAVKYDMKKKYKQLNSFPRKKNYKKNWENP